MLMTLDDFKVQIKTWLKANKHDYTWLASQLNNVSESTIRNWMARKDIPMAKRQELAAVCDIDLEEDPIEDTTDQQPVKHRVAKERPAKEDSPVVVIDDTPVIKASTIQLDIDPIYIHRLEMAAAKQGKTGMDLLEEFFKGLPNE